MKKVILMLALFSAVVCAKAQIATENSTLLDNTYVTINGGVATPLAFDAVFPLNPTAGLAIGKWLTPEYGVEVEGTAWFGSHVYGGSDARVNANANGNFNAIRGSYVGLNGIINLANLLNGYNGSPRSFEVNTLVGIGWVHGYTPNTNDRYNNSLGAKTGLDLAFNLGKKKAHTLSIRPAVLWDLSKPGTSIGSLAFNKHGAQLYLGIGYTYHFKNTNGTHSFKTYDIGAMINEIDRLNWALNECEKRPARVVEKIVKVKDAVTVPTQTEWFVQFAQKSADLTPEAKAVLDKVGNDLVVNVVGTSSPEGDNTFNQRLSEKRAAVVADYLTKRGVKVNSWVGKGVQIGLSTNRLAIVTVAQ